MGNFEPPEAPDAIDEAIAETEPPPAPTQMTNRAVFPNGQHITLTVPLDFDADQFETAVGMLMQLRVKAEAIKAEQANAGLTLPQKPKLVSVAGRPLS
jgi:hypothetical protein